MMAAESVQLHLQVSESGEASVSPQRDLVFHTFHGPNHLHHQQSRFSLTQKLHHLNVLKNAKAVELLMHKPGANYL